MGDMKWKENGEEGVGGGMRRRLEGEEAITLHRLEKWVWKLIL